VSRNVLAAVWLSASLLIGQGGDRASAQELRCNPECVATLKGSPAFEVQRNCCVPAAAPVESTGNYCSYEAGVCAMIQPNRLGLTCICPGPNGPLSGKIVRESTSKWSYGVHWCTDQPENESFSLYIEQALRRTLPKSTTKSSRSPKDNEAANYRGLVIRYADGDTSKAQAEFVQALLVQQLRRKATLAKSRSDHPDYISIFICGVPPRLPD